MALRAAMARGVWVGGRGKGGGGLEGEGAHTNSPDRCGKGGNKWTKNGLTSLAAQTLPRSTKGAADGLV